MAIKAGYDGFRVRDPETMSGEDLIFEMPDGMTATWFVEVDENDKPIKAIPKEKKDKRIPGAGPAKGSQMIAEPDRSFPNGQPQS
jgi:hypothetical protein